MESLDDFRRFLPMLKSRPKDGIKVFEQYLMRYAPFEDEILDSGLLCIEKQIEMAQRAEAKVEKAICGRLISGDTIGEEEKQLLEI